MGQVSRDLVPQDEGGSLSLSLMMSTWIALRLLICVRVPVQCCSYNLSASWYWGRRLDVYIAIMH